MEVRSSESCSRAREIGRQFPGDPSGRYLLAPARVLTTPERREITRPAAFGPGSQRRQGQRGQGKRRRSDAHRAELPHDVVHDAARGPAGEHVGDRRVAGGLALRARRDAPRWSFASGQSRYAVPTWTPAAPSAMAAATPFASAIPPAAMTGTFTARTICGSERECPRSGWSDRPTGTCRDARPLRDPAR